MAAKKYLKGFLKHFFNNRISKFALVDDNSIIQKTAKIGRFAKALNSELGAYSYIGSSSQLVHAKVGKYCSIASQCLIGLATHPIEFMSTSQIFVLKNNPTGYRWSSDDKFIPYNKVNIGNDVWIGARVIIMGGVNIGNGAIIGSGAIVTKDIPDYAIAVGVPARVIKYRFPPLLISKLNNLKWWDLPENVLKKNLSIFKKSKLDEKDIESILLS